MGQRARFAGSVVGACVVCGLVSSCKEATQIVVEARTNLVYRGGLVVAFTVGSPGETEHADPTTEWRDGWAADGVIGSLAVVPGSGKDAALGVKLVMGVDRDARSCAPPEYRGCIVARRLLRYTPHSRLRLPITLYAQCKNVLCNEASTCNVLGQCVPAQVDQVTCSSPDGCAVVGDPQPRMPPPIDASTSDGPIGTPDGAIPEGGADAADAKADGADAATSGTPGTIDCGAQTCDLTASEKCCWDSNLFKGACAGPALQCAVTGGRYEILCDGDEDCMAGRHCCAAAGNVTFCSTSCSPYPNVCHSTNLCAVGQCTGLFANRYLICQ